MEDRAVDDTTFDSDTDLSIGRNQPQMSGMYLVVFEGFDIAPTLEFQTSPRTHLVDDHRSFVRVLVPREREGGRFPLGRGALDEDVRHF